MKERELDTLSRSSSVYSSRTALVETNEEDRLQKHGGEESDGRKRRECTAYELGILPRGEFDPYREYGLHQDISSSGAYSARGRSSYGNDSQGRSSYRQSSYGFSSFGHSSLGQSSREQPSREQPSRRQSSSSHEHASYDHAPRIREVDRLPLNPAASEYQGMGGNPWV